MISSLLKFQIEVLSLGTDLDSCKSECKSLDGHLPFLFEGWDAFELIRGFMLVTYEQMSRLHQCWRRMLETKYVGDGFGHFGHQHAQMVTNFKSPISLSPMSPTAT